MAADTASERDTLRRALRARRRELTSTERAIAQARLLGALRTLSSYRRARHVGIYFANDGEADLSELFTAALRRGVALYAPVLADDRLAFHAFDADSALTLNRYGILEPDGGAAIDPRSLDLVLTPLVGFDRAGARLGMGKGYYDRTFRFLRHRRCWRKPKLIGVGFAFQEVTSLTIESWDVALSGIVTDAGAMCFRRSLQQ